MNSLIQILFVKSHNGFADQSQVYGGIKDQDYLSFCIFFHVPSGSGNPEFTFSVSCSLWIFSVPHRSFSTIIWILGLKRGIKMGKGSWGLNPQSSQIGGAIPYPNIPNSRSGMFPILPPPHSDNPRALCPGEMKLLQHLNHSV